MNFDVPLVANEDEKEVMDFQVLVRGSGSMGSRYLQLFQDELGISPIVFPKRNERMVELTGQGFQVIKDLAELDRSSPVYSIVATDTSEHLEDVKALSPYGRVLVEKPLTSSMRELKNFRKDTDLKTSSLSVAFCWRFSLAAEFVRKKVECLGQIHQVRIECSSFLPEWRPGTAYKRSYSAKAGQGGVLRDLAHEIDYATWIFGYPEEVLGVLSNSGYLGIEAEESADLLWITPDGVTVSLRLDYLSKHPVRFLKASGERGDVTWNLLESTVSVQMEDGSEQKYKFKDDRNLMLLRQINAFLGLPDAKGTLASFEEGAKVVALSDAARISSSSKAWQSASYL